VGVVIAAEGAGAIVAATVTSRLVQRLGSARALLLATTLAPVLSVFMPLATSGAGIVVFVVGITGSAACVTVLSVVTRTHRQLASPADLLSRVMASVRFISWGAVPIGALLAGAAAQLWSPRAGLGLACVAFFVAPLALWGSQIRRLRDLGDAESAAVPA
jgi:predicted MFS family arabinose efflux permease